MKTKIKTGGENGSRAKLTSLTCDQAVILPRKQKKKENKRTEVRLEEICREIANLTLMLSLLNLT